ncbi:MAG: T9SS type A sorting domain-containing protein, partial [Candidatus Eisenbacteria sp.]|nr:T9SS type A sorting domain-containing protein [Candidatus Eisenbacteria bacterium]
DTLDVGNVTQALLPSLGVGTTYYIAVTCYDHGNDESWYSAELIASTNNPAANADASDKWLTLRLDPNLPNPFRAQTAISYFVPAHGRAQLEVYDLQGRRVVTLEDAIKALGWHSVLWNGRDEAGLRASPGVYFLRLDAGGQRSARKLVLIK